MQAFLPTRFSVVPVRVAIAAVTLVLAGCGGGTDRSQSSEAPPPVRQPAQETNTVGVSPAQAGYDNGVARFDQIPTPESGGAVITAAAITAVQIAFDKVADDLIAL